MWEKFIFYNIKCDINKALNSNNYNFALNLIELVQIKMTHEFN